MRSKVLILGCFVAVAATAFAAGSIISSFRSPSSYVTGMAHYGPYLYHADYSNSNIHVTTTTGSIVGTVPAQASILGVDFNGTYFWIATYTSPYYVYQLTSNGSVVRSFAGPAPGYGITFDGTYLWFGSARSTYIFQLTTTGSVVKSMACPGSFTGGLDWANGYIWVADWPSSNAGVYRITTNGSVVESYVPVPSSGRSSGVAWDGTYLWYSDYTSSYVYQMDTVLTSIVPSSLGRIKSIYR